MSNLIANAALVSDTCEIKHVTIVANLRKSTVDVTIEHTPEETVNEDGEPRCIEARRFSRWVSSPIEAARRMGREARNVHPRAIVELVNA